MCTTKLDKSSGIQVPVRFLSGLFLKFVLEWYADMSDCIIFVKMIEAIVE